MALVVGCGGQTEAPAAEQTLTFNLGREPASLDPGLVTDLYSAVVVLALTDPLVRLGPDLEPVPAMAESWEVSAGGKVVTFRLRADGRWTNGDRLTARDYEYAWKRTLSPELGAGYAYSLFGIEGAAPYNGCDPKKADCRRLRDRVGVRALDERTLQVRLTSPQPWFVAQVANAVFTPVHRATVERFGERWTEPEHIVTSGPFRLTSWAHDSSLTLTRWPEWRGAGSVKLERIEARMIAEASTALAAFEAREIDACFEQPTCIPLDELDRLRATPEFHEVSSLSTQFIGLNVRNVPDPDQRRALALAIDRRTLVEEVIRLGRPAATFTPLGMPGYGTIRQDFISRTPDVARARALLARSKPLERRIDFFLPSDDVSRAIGVTIQAMWKEIGVTTRLRTVEFGRLLGLLGPPPAEDVDAYFLGWIGDYPDAFNFLEVWTCESGTNFAGFCDPAYDTLVARARATAAESARHRLYARLERRLTGPDGAFPLVPLSWSTLAVLRRQDVVGWEPNRLGLIDLAAVSRSP